MHKEEQHQRVAQVLQLVVQHCPAASSSAKGLCTLLLVSRACRGSMQQAVGHLLLEFAAKDSLQQTASKASWLRKHAGLVAKLEVASSSEAGQNGQRQVADPLITLALEVSTQPGRTVLTGEGTTQPAAMLQLQEYTSNCVYNADAMRALTASTSLRRMQLRDIQSTSMTASFCAALAQLKSLDTLFIQTEAAVNLPPAFGSALASLCNLKECVLLCRSTEWIVQQLPASLYRLVLVLAPLDASQSPAARVEPSFQHLTRLRGCYLAAPIDQHRLVFPSSLKHLTIRGTVLSVSGLLGLTQLCVSEPKNMLPLLQRLPGMGRLRRLEMELSSCPQEDLPQVLAALGAATQVTALTLQRDDTFCRASEVPSAPLDLGAVMLSSHICKLQALCRLELLRLDLSCNDVIALGALTGLTAFALRFARRAGDIATAVIVSRLTGLKALCLVDCWLESPAIWAALACLTQLASLDMRHGAPVLMDESLNLLRPLAQLSALRVDAGANQTTAEGFASFEAAMPALPRVHFL